MTLAVGPDPEEATFLAEYDPTKFPPMAVTVDVAALTIRDGELCVLVIQRERPPFKDHWALPGRFVQQGVTLERTAIEAVSLKANISISWMKQLATYGDPDRDPRMRVFSVAYLAFGPIRGEAKAGYHAKDAEWLPVFKSGPASWAFDHSIIVLDAITRAQSKLEYTSLATRFLPSEFTITDLRKVYETVWNRGLDPGNFHRKVKGTDGFVERTRTKRGSAQLYRAGDAKLLYPPIRRDEADWS